MGLFPCNFVLVHEKACSKHAASRVARECVTSRPYTRCLIFDLRTIRIYCLLAFDLFLFAKLYDKFGK